MMAYMSRLKLCYVCIDDGNSWVTIHTYMVDAYCIQYTMQKQMSAL